MTPFAPTHRIKCGPGFFGESSKFDGSIIDYRVHDTNGKAMFRLEFPNPMHQNLWGGAWFYLDDLEQIQ